MNGYGNVYEAPAGLGTGVLMVVLVLLLYLLIWGIALVSYILSSLAYYKIAKRRGIKNPWLSWIPVGNSWIMGRVANEYDKRNGHDRPWHKALLSLCIIAAVTFVLFYTMFLIFMVKTMIAFDYGYYDGGMLFAVAYIGLLVAAVVATVYSMLSAICVYKTFESTLPEKALKYIILYFLVPLAGPICLIKCADKGYEYTEESVFANQPFSEPDVTAIEPAEEVTEETINPETTEE